MTASGKAVSDGAQYQQAVANVVKMSKILDEWNAELPASTQIWQRSGKIGEEFGEVIDALIGMQGQNPRKGVYKTIEDVKKELLDVAITALGAYEHVTENHGYAISDLFVQLSEVRIRLEIADAESKITPAQRAEELRKLR